MKTLIKLNLLLIIIVTLATHNGGAKNNTDKTILRNTPSLSIYQTSNSPNIVGTWKMSSYKRDTVDLTKQFDGYIFTCNPDGRMTIHGNGYNYTNCWWNNFDDCCMNSNRYSKNSMFHFHMMGCENNSILWNLQEDWDLIKNDTYKIYFTCHNPNVHCSMTWIRIKQ